MKANAEIMTELDNLKEATSPADVERRLNYLRNYATVQVKATKTQTGQKWSEKQPVKYQEKKDNKTSSRYSKPHSAVFGMSRNPATSSHPSHPPGVMVATRASNNESSEPGSRLAAFWQVWHNYLLNQRVVLILKDGYCLNFKQKSPLSNQCMIKSRYTDLVKQNFLTQAVRDMLVIKAVIPIQKSTSLRFFDCF